MEQKIYSIEMGAAKCAVDLGDGSERGEGHDKDREHDREHAWKSQITPLNAVNYAIIGGLGGLEAALGALLLAGRRRMAL